MECNANMNRRKDDENIKDLKNKIEEMDKKIIKIYELLVPMSIDDNVGLINLVNKMRRQMATIWKTIIFISSIAFVELVRFISSYFKQKGDI